MQSPWPYLIASNGVSQYAMQVRICTNISILLYFVIHRYSN